MTAIAAKAKELKQQGDQQREQKASKLAENLGKKAKTAAAKEAAPAKKYKVPETVHEREPNRLPNAARNTLFAAAGCAVEVCI